MDRAPYFPFPLLIAGAVFGQMCPPRSRMPWSRGHTVTRIGVALAPEPALCLYILEADSERITI